jgi:MATE family multidrug resistance protein
MLDRAPVPASSFIVVRLLRLAWPVALARLGIMAMGIVDVVVVGQLAPSELPHQALGWAPTAILLVSAIGLLTGVQVLAARALGEGQPAHAGGVWRRGMLVAGASGALAAILMWAGGARLLTVFGIAPQLAAPAARVMSVLGLSVPLHLLYIASAFFLEAIQRPLPSTIVMWCANVLNLVLNLVLVPEYGALGSAYATVAARAFLAATLAWYVLSMRDAARFGVRRGPSGPGYRALLRVGVAAALSQAAEAGAFSGMTILAGRIGERAVAAYQILLNLLAVVFMVALGVSAATAVLAPEAVGRGDPRAAMRASFVGLALNTVIMALLALAGSACGQALGRAYTADASLAALAASLVPLTLVVTLPDGGQVVAAAALRAQSDNWFPTGSHVLAYAVVMPPLAYYLAERAQQGVAGLMHAILVASALSVAVLTLRLGWLARRT